MPHCRNGAFGEALFFVLSFDILLLPHGNPSHNFLHGFELILLCYNANMPGELPNARKARINTRKLRDYALNPKHETGKYKATFFKQMGYTAEKWETLEGDIRTQHLAQPVEVGQPSPFGQKYTITALLQGPQGEARWVTTVWIIRPGADQPELVTIEPATRRKVGNNE